MKKIIVGLSLILACITDGNCNPRPLMRSHHSDHRIVTSDVRDAIRDNIRNIVFSIPSIMNQVPARINANNFIRDILKRGESSASSLESIYDLIKKHCRSRDELRHTTLRELSECILRNFDGFSAIYDVALRQLQSLPIA